MKCDNDTSGLVGGPIIRYGGKGRIAQHLLPHFAPAKVYAEPFFGAGSVFYRIPPGTYEREAVNDLDASIVTFFRVLRDRADDLVRVCEATPYARDEFAACLARSDDPLEEARRVWVRTRQGFSGNADSAANWARNVGAENIGAWNPRKMNTKLDALRTYAARLRSVAIDNIDAVEFVERWGQRETFVYADPPYVHESRSGGGEQTDYAHEMTDDDHRRVAASLRAAVERGAKVAVSGYASPLYDELFAGWRTVTLDVAAYAARGDVSRRTEVLWMSYPAAESFAGIEAAKRDAQQPSLFDARRPEAT